MFKKIVVEKIKHDIDINEDIEHHISAWKFRRVGSVMMALFVISALLGFFGNGPMSSKKQIQQNDTLEYERFTRFQSHTSINLKLDNLQDTTRIAFPQQYLKNFQIESVFPEPQENRIQNDTLVYFFKTLKKGTIQFYMTPQKEGSVEGTIVVNEKHFDLSHFIFP